MPKISQETAPDVQDMGLAVDSRGDLDGYTVDFVTIREGHSLDEFLKALPDGKCPCPRWGYLIAGKITVRYADREESYEAGDAFYMPPGHVPGAETGTEFVQFSPKDKLAEVMAVIASNAERAGQQT